MSLTDLQNLKAKRNRIIGMKKIDLMDIRPNTLNCFPQDDIEELKDNIFAEGYRNLWKFIRMVITIFCLEDIEDTMH